MRLELIAAALDERAAGDGILDGQHLYKVVMDERAYQAERLASLKAVLQAVAFGEARDDAPDPASMEASIAEIEGRVKVLTALAKEAIGQRP
jgi:hypothetical protein